MSSTVFRATSYIEVNEMKMYPITVSSLIFPYGGLNCHIRTATCGKTSLCGTDCLNAVLDPEALLRVNKPNISQTAGTKFTGSSVI